MSDAKKPEDQNQHIIEPSLPDEQLTVDTEPEQKTTDAQENTPESETSDVVAEQPANSGKTAVVLALIALLAVPALGYWSYLELQALREKQTAASTQLADEIASKNSALRNQVNKLEDELARLDDEREAQNLLLERTQTRLSDAIKQVEAGRSTSEADWRLAEAQYLLRLANQRVLMEQRPEGALTLLRSADKVLADLDDVSLYGLRQALAQDEGRRAGARA